MKTILLLTLAPVLLLAARPAEGRAEPLTRRDQRRLRYFPASYQQARTQFRASAATLKRRFGELEVSKIVVASRADRDLTIDYCYLPPKPGPGPRKLVVMTSGVHGVEGFVGSAMQQLFMREVLPGLRRRSDVGVLLVHGINPWGYKHGRRVSERFVDLNRNCDVERGLFATNNPGYDKLAGFLNPQGKARHRTWRNPAFLAQVGWKLLRHGKSTLRQAILGGQYEHEQGLYFGGKEFEPQKPALERLLQQKARGASEVLLADVHTGYGERGRLHLFGPSSPGPRNAAAIKRTFAGYPIDAAGTGDFYTTTGDFPVYVAKLLSDKTVVPMTLEYGTVGRKFWHDLKSLQTMRLENQGYRFGYRSQRDRAKIQQGLLEMYNPSSPAFRTQIMRTTAEWLPRFVDNFAAAAQ